MNLGRVQFKFTDLVLNKKYKFIRVHGVLEFKGPHVLKFIFNSMIVSFFIFQFGDWDDRNIEI